MTAERPSPTFALAATLIAIVGVVLFGALIGLLVRLGLPLTQNAVQAVSIGFQGMIFAVPTLLYYRFRPAAYPAMRTQGIEPGCAALIALAAIVGVFALNMVTQYWMYVLHLFGLQVGASGAEMPQSLQEMWLMMAASSLAPALFEEVLFRGMLLPSMERLGQRAAILISSALFALMHGNIQSLPTVLLLGGMLAMLVLRTDSLFAAMLYHLVYNGTIILLTFRAAQGGASSGTAVTLFMLIQSLPVLMLLIGLWLLLSYLAMLRGEQTRAHTLAVAEQGPLPVPALVLLACCFGLLLWLNISSIAQLLPGMAA